MAKRVTFLLVLLLVLLTASVTAFATGTESTTPEASFTNDEADFLEISTSGLEELYSDVFFNESSVSDTQIITIMYERAISMGNSLRFTFTGTSSDMSTNMDNPIMMLLYIKVDGKYIPLVDIGTGENITEGLVVTNSEVDLEYLGTKKVNEVRLIAFRKNNADILKVNENLQITDLDITVRPWNFVEKVKMTYDLLVNSLTQP